MIDPEVERRRMQAAIAADSAAMSRRMAFDRPTPDVAVPADAARKDGSTPGSAGSTSGGGQAINQLFVPPSYNESLPYYQAVEKAKSEGKWLLVNIQQAEVFASLQLNRDVWSDDIIMDVVQGSFLLWQRDDKSTEGEQFCQYHQCGHQLPHICVIDPRTGRKVKAWDGRKWTESHAAAEFLFGFLDEFSMSRSPPALSPAGSPQMSPQAPPSGGTGGTEVRLTGLDDESMDLDSLTGGAIASGSGRAVTAGGGGQSPQDAMMQPEQVKEAIAVMPEEPPETVEHLKVSFKLPSGAARVRRFLASAKLEDMFAVASALVEHPVSRVDLSTQFPKRSLRDIAGGFDASLKDAQVAGNVILVSVRS